MTKYKIGDVAALFSKPKSPTTTGGKKLQSLFEDYYNKKSSPNFHSQESSSGVNKNEGDKEINEKSASKKSRKRKLSSFDDSEFTENVSSKKFKESSEQNSSTNREHKKQKLRKLKDFPRKKNKNRNLNNNVSYKFEESLSYQQKESPDHKSKKFKMQQDFPRKNKLSKDNSFSTSSVFPKFDAENNSENDSELPSAPLLKSVQKENKKNKNFIKKSKKKQNLDQSRSKLSNDISYNDSDDDGDDASLREEIKEFMHSNSVNKEMEKNNDKTGETFNLKNQNTMGKQKKKFSANESSFQKYKESPEQGIKSKKKSKKYNANQQDQPEVNSPDFNMESKTTYKGFKQNSPSKKQNSFDQVSAKKSKKPKHNLNVTNVNSDVTLENNSEINITKAKAIDFKRTPKNKNNYDTSGKDNFKNPNGKAFNDLNGDKSFKNEEFNVNKTQKGEAKAFEVKAPDFIKLPSLDEDDEKSFEERLSRTLFVGNLPKTISKQELKNLFSSFGTVVAVRLPGIETDKAKIFGKNPPKLLHSNYASDTVPGFIVFKEKQSAVEALKLSGSVFKGHHITVDFALPAGTHKLYDEKRSIFIGNLPFNVKDESIWNAFNHCGRIEGVRVVRDRQTGLGKGFGYVLFSTVEAKQKALALQSLNIEGREIRIKAVDSNQKNRKSGSSPSTKRDTFKSRAIRMKKNINATSGHKTIRKLTNKQKMLHKKKKTAEILQKAMK